MEKDPYLGKTFEVTTKNRNPIQNSGKFIVKYKSISYDNDQYARYVFVKLGNKNTSFDLYCYGNIPAEISYSRKRQRYFIEIVINKINSDNFILKEIV